MKVTPSRVCELKYLVVDFLKDTQEVTPSRVCELKSFYWEAVKLRYRHTLTGV